MLELLTGAIVAAAVVALILGPLIRPRAAAIPSIETDFYELEESDSPKVRALLALREIEFDRATGKLSEEDYSRMKTRYGRLALQAMEDGEDQHDATDSTKVAEDTEDLAEQAIASIRSRGTRQCVQCGVRPEPTAVFCSRCGRSLLEEQSNARCWMCGTELPDDARFCGSCGFALSA